MDDDDTSFGRGKGGKHIPWWTQADLDVVKEERTGSAIPSRPGKAGNEAQIADPNVVKQEIIIPKQK